MTLPSMCGGVRSWMAESAKMENTQQTNCPAANDSTSAARSSSVRTPGCSSTYMDSANFSV